MQEQDEIRIEEIYIEWKKIWDFWYLKENRFLSLKEVLNKYFKVNK